MKHLMTILKYKHIRNGVCIFEKDNIKNTFHQGGERFILSVTFCSSCGYSVPTNYYLGLDNRGTVQATDTLSSLQNEPNSSGYIRQPINSSNGFSVALSGSNYFATSNTVSFTASGGTWGPVQNIFLSTTLNNTGILIATASLGGSETVQDGDQLTMSFQLGLSN